MTADLIQVKFVLCIIRCYGCDDEVPVEPESTIHNCIKLILKAMNLSPPPGNFLQDTLLSGVFHHQRCQR